MEQENLNGGWKTTKSKKLASRLQIIGETPLMTKDLKEIIKYLEEIVINKDTLQTLNTGELVMNINKLIQCVEVLSIYKQPMINLLTEYNHVTSVIENGYIGKSNKIYKEKEIIENLLSKIHIENPKILRKEYWVDYE